MKQLPQLSDAEWQVIKVVWKKAPCLAQDIIHALTPTTTWSPATVKTLLNRMTHKGALHYEKSGKAYVYRPAFSEAELRAVEAESFLTRVFDGALSPMLAHFVQSRKLSEEDIRSLEELLRASSKTGEDK